MPRPTKRQFKKVLTAYKLSESLKDSICDNDPSAQVILERLSKLRKFQQMNQKNRMHRRVWRDYVVPYIRSRKGQSK